MTTRSAKSGPPVPVGSLLDVDRCPSVLALHQAEDGWLARIRLPGGRISAQQLMTLAYLAKSGNGIVELTARANFQVRGLSRESGPRTAEQLQAVGLLPSISHERVRNILASPIAGRHHDAVTSTDELVLELDRAICANPELSALSGRFLFGVDDGSGLLASEDLDVGLFAECANSSMVKDPTFRLVLDNSPTTISAARTEAVETALNAALAFLAASRSKTERVWRVRDLPKGAASLALILGCALHAPSKARRESRDYLLGSQIQNDGRWAISAMPPLGRLSSSTIEALGAVAQLTGGDVRLSPWRTLTMVDVAPEDAPTVAVKLEQIGLQLTPNGWMGLSACAGLGACTKALTDVRAAAERRARYRDAKAPVEHWSACEKGCGTPRRTEVRVHATGDHLVIHDDRGALVASDVDEALSLLKRGG